MINPEQIPDEAAETLAKNRVTKMGGDWSELHVSNRATLFFAAREELAAALNAWPDIAAAIRGLKGKD
jgi:hypothetical protein